MAVVRGTVRYTIGGTRRPRPTQSCVLLSHVFPAFPVRPTMPPAALPASQLARVSQGLALARTSARLAQEAVARSSRPLIPGAVLGVPEGAGLPPTPYVAETMAALQEAAQELGPQVCRNFGWGRVCFYGPWFSARRAARCALEQASR